MVFAIAKAYHYHILRLFAWSFFNNKTYLYYFYKVFHYIIYLLNIWLYFSFNHPRKGKGC